MTWMSQTKSAAVESIHRLETLIMRTVVHLVQAEEKKMLRLEKDILQYSDTQADCTPKALNVVHLNEHLRAKEINHCHGQNRTPSIMQISEG